MHHPDTGRPIAIDTLGKLAAHGHGLGATASTAPPTARSCCP
jgi:hypothetical protein